ncbi:MAG: tetratricopeptide repeat protein [Kiloniellales bacterium]|nr:tetratricopeptide repeat protein [Kiloniellales bacterium]
MDLNAAYQQGLQEFRAGRLAAAESAFRRVLKMQPDQPDALHLLGVLAHQRGDPQKAVKLFKKAVRRKPRDPNFRTNLGSALQALGRGQSALENFQKALAADPDHLPARYNLGNLLFEQGKFQPALVAFRQTVELEPTFADAHYNLANTLRRLDDARGAVAAYRRCLELKPGFAPANFNLGNALRDLGDLEGAQASYERALELDPKLANAEVNLAGVLKRQRDFHGALAHCNRALALQPDLAEAHANLGHIHLLAEELDAALAAYRRAVELDPSFAAGHMGLAATLGKLGRLDDARWYSRRGLEHNRTSVRPARGKEAGRVVVLKGLEDGLFEIGPDNSFRTFVGMNNADSHFDVETFRQCDLYVDELEPERAAEVLANCDVIFNAISDADAMPNCLTSAEAIAEHAGVPVLNAPAAIMQTQRDQNFEVLRGLDGIVFPKTLRIAGEERESAELPALLAAKEFRYPLLLRRAGTHTGESLERIDDADAFAAYLAEVDGGALYISEFIDFSGSRGVFTKMRAFFVDGELYPVHLFISEDWYVRGHDEARRLMLENGWMLDAKKTFLAEPRAYLGEAAYRALLSIRDAIPLDYFGVDFAKLDDDRLLVFEANAVMNHHYHFIDDFPFQKAYLDAVTQALNRLLLTRIEAAKLTE